MSKCVLGRLLWRMRNVKVRSVSLLHTLDTSRGKVQSQTWLASWQHCWACPSRCGYTAMGDCPDTHRIATVLCRLSPSPPQTLILAMFSWDSGFAFWSKFSRTFVVLNTDYILRKTDGAGSVLVSASPAISKGFASVESADQCMWPLRMQCSQKEGRKLEWFPPGGFLCLQSLVDEKHSMLFSYELLCAFYRQCPCMN